MKQTENGVDVTYFGASYRTYMVIIMSCVWDNEQKYCEATQFSDSETQSSDYSNEAHQSCMVLNVSTCCHTCEASRRRAGFHLQQPV